MSGISAKAEKKVEEIRKLSVSLKVEKLEMEKLRAESDRIKNAIVFKTNEITKLESDINQGYNALGKILVE